MAIELGSMAPVQPKSGAGRASGKEAVADGEGSFASALSASNAGPVPDRKVTPAPERSATKTPRANERGQVQDKGKEIDDGGERDAVATGADAGEDATAAGATGATNATTATTATTASTVESPAISLPPQPPQSPPVQMTSLPLPAESAMLLAQSALAGPAAREANQRAAEVTPAVALAAGPLPATAPTSPTSRALPSTDTLPVFATEKLPVAVSQQPAAGLPVANAASPETDLALQALSARTIGARAVPVAATRTSDAEAVAAPTTPLTPLTSVTSATSATSALAASFTSAIPQQTQRAVVQAQAQVTDRAALQAPNATMALDSRAAESLAAAGMAGGTSVDASASPLLRRFERVLSMTHAASGEGQGFGSGAATTAATWMTPVTSAGAAVNASMGGMTDRLAESMNGLLAQVVAQKNHNASLTVDVGGQPVSVNVQVQGNEAQVVFRADQAETRAMLAQALPQLRQMMGAEGLVLSDASVAGQWAGGGTQAGAGGSGGSNGAGDSDARRGAVPVRIDAGVPVVGAAAGTASRTSGTRSLDLYV